MYGTQAVTATISMRIFHIPCYMSMVITAKFCDEDKLHSFQCVFPTLPMVDSLDTT